MIRKLIWQVLHNNQISLAHETHTQHGSFNLPFITISRKFQNSLLNNSNLLKPFVNYLESPKTKIIFRPMTLMKKSASFGQQVFCLKLCRPIRCTEPEMYQGASKKTHFCSKSQNIFYSLSRQIQILLENGFFFIDFIMCAKMVFQFQPF